MPRVDDFRKSADPNYIVSTEKSQLANNSQKEKISTSTDREETTLDFNPYLREPKYTLNDVILSQTTHSQIMTALAEIEYQDLIFNEWGMAEKHKLDTALSINFSGFPGTGKTITAEAVAHAMSRKIVDLPYQFLESKYVGETPKNIAQAFRFAADSNAVLFFDEADSFLGKRLESVTQSTDTAVNLTRSVMLKQLSEFQGVVIFATNLVSNYDSAFISRIRWKIQFDLPDKEARSRIWKIQFPEKLPLDNAVDCDALAKKFDNISGRDIKNAVFQAVVSAAREEKRKSEKKVTQLHLENSISQIIEANKASQKSTLTFQPVEGKVNLPPEHEN